MLRNVFYLVGICLVCGVFAYTLFNTGRLILGINTHWAVDGIVGCIFGGVVCHYILKHPK